VCIYSIVSNRHVFDPRPNFKSVKQAVVGRVSCGFPAWTVSLAVACGRRFTQRHWDLRWGCLGCRQSSWTAQRWHCCGGV